MSKRQILEYLLETNTSVSIAQMCFALLAAMVLGIFMYFVYRATYRGTLYSKTSTSPWCWSPSSPRWS